MNQTAQQKRAKYALEQVQHFLPIANHKKFKARANELPFMIRANGLGQALAFFRSKGTKDGYNHLHDVLAGWLVQEGKPFEGHVANEVMEALMNCDQQIYRIAQVESLLLMSWVKQFASAYMEGTT